MHCTTALGRAVELPNTNATCRDSERWLAQLRDSSAPLLLPGSVEAAPLPLLAAAATQGAGAGGADRRAPADSVFFVGGPVWALEWCPWAGAAEPDVQHLAVRARRWCLCKR